MIEEDDRVAMRWTCTGRFTGEFMGAAPTNEVVTVDGMHFFHVRDGRVVETSVQYDSANFMKTVGVVSLG